MHCRARLMISYQALFKIFSQLISNSSKIQEFINTTSQFQARSENLTNQNLKYKQDSRMTKGPVLATKEVKIHRQNIDIH